jgi:hypothetical protein
LWFVGNITPCHDDEGNKNFKNACALMPHVASTAWKW